MARKTRFISIALSLVAYSLNVYGIAYDFHEKPGYYESDIPGTFPVIEDTDFVYWEKRAVDWIENREKFRQSVSGCRDFQFLLWANAYARVTGNYSYLAIVSADCQKGGKRETTIAELKRRVFRFSKKRPYAALVRETVHPTYTLELTVLGNALVYTLHQYNFYWGFRVQHEEFVALENEFEKLLLTLSGDKVDQAGIPQKIRALRADLHRIRQVAGYLNRNYFMPLLETEYRKNMESIRMIHELCYRQAKEALSPAPQAMDAIPRRVSKFLFQIYNPSGLKNPTCLHFDYYNFIEAHTCTKDGFPALLPDLNEAYHQAESGRDISEEEQEALKRLYADWLDVPYTTVPECKVR